MGLEASKKEKIEPIIIEIMDYDNLDLVLRLDNVARVRARILFNAGYHTATKVKKENPYVLNRKTGLGINLCKKIVGKK